MNKFKLSLLGAIIGLSLNNALFALTPPTTFRDTYTNEFVFIENDIDGEYFISAEDLDPRFTGANVWTKHGREKQTSLGYMIIGRSSFASRNNVDVWMESPDVPFPFIGIRCQTSTSTCPSTSYVSSPYVDRNGVYKILPTSTRTKYMSFNEGMYTFLKNAAVDSTLSFIVNNCETTLDYDPSRGQYCRDMSTGTWLKSQFNSQKLGHLTLYDNKAFSEIWVATDGTPSLTSNNEACEYIVIGTGTRNEGVACKMVSYNLNGQPSAFNNSTYLYMEIEKAALNNMTIANADIKINAGGSATWANWVESTSTNNRMSNQLVSGNGYIRVLFTKSFFQNMLRAGASTSGQKGIFTFGIKNTKFPQSGFYQFETNMDIDIIPREYGISIKHQDVNDQKKSGRIGETEQDIVFNYVVTQSAPRKADSVTASVVGESTVISAKSYCLFKSTDDYLKVPIPAYLSYKNSSGRDIEQESGCDTSKLLNLTNALWSEVPWDAQRSGFFYSTDLTLRFPMNNPRSLFTINGIDWLGSVQAEGDVKVEAKWIGVQRGVSVPEPEPEDIDEEPEQPVTPLPPEDDE